MITEQIKDVRKFMSKLLVDSYFDDFLVNDVTITTYNTFKIDGHINKDFYTEDELLALPDEHLSYWSKLRPFCYSVIKGKKTPLKFKLIFALDRSRIEKLLETTDTSITAADVNELFLNLKFENGILSYVTGCSLKIFTMDKSLEKAFDQDIADFISSI